MRTTYTKDYPRTLANKAKPVPNTNKILIAFPFWSGDKAAFSKLIRLVADLEDTKSEFADALIVARFDAKIDPRDIEAASRRFNVHTYTSRRRETGWPQGCNGLFFGTMEWFAQSILGHTIPGYKAILICEADTVPLSKNWIESLINSWDAQNKVRPVVIAGAMVGGAQFGREHINGGAVMMSSKPEFLRWIVSTSAGYSVRAGWDWALAGEFEKRGWASIPSMASFWQRPTMAVAEVRQLMKDGLVLLHGIKDDSLVSHVRKILLR